MIKKIKQVRITMKDFLRNYKEHCEYLSQDENKGEEIIVTWHDKYLFRVRLEDIL